MDLERLAWIFPFDIEVLTLNFMRLYLKMAKHDPQPEELVAFVTDQMGKFAWKDPEHFIYVWMLKQAVKVINEYNKEDDDT